MITKKLSTGMRLIKNKELNLPFFIHLIKKNTYLPLTSTFYKCINYKGYNHKGQSVLDGEWDYLIILDACRYDIFSRVNWIDGELKKRISLGSHTLEWARNNFTNFYNIIYLSTNPFISDFTFRGFNASKHFSKVINLYSGEGGKKSKSFLRDIHPKNVTKRAIKHIRSNFGSKFIIHYLQPHQPFLHNMYVDYNTYHKGEVNIEEFRMAYVENLILALSYIEKLLNVIDSDKVVITADHGELLGEKHLVGHHQGIYFKELVEVPWLAVK